MQLAESNSRISMEGDVVGKKSLWLSEGERLLAAARCGDRAAFGELTERCADKLFHTAVRITANREEAEDAVQDALLSAMLHLDGFDGRSSFFTWLTRITINAALMRLRKNHRLREVPMEPRADLDEEPDQREFPSDAPDPEQSYVERERHSILKEAIFSLRPSLRVAVEAYHFRERSVRETAEMLDISMEAVKGRLYHARAKLRREPRIRNIMEPTLASAARQEKESLGGAAMFPSCSRE